MYLSGRAFTLHVNYKLTLWQGMVWGQEAKEKMHTYIIIIHHCELSYFNKSKRNQANFLPGDFVACYALENLRDSQFQHDFMPSVYYVSL